LSDAPNGHAVPVCGRVKDGALSGWENGWFSPRCPANPVATPTFLPNVANPPKVSSSMHIIWLIGTFRGGKLIWKKRA